MNNAMNNSDSNGNGQQSPVGEPANGRQQKDTKSPVLTQPANIAMTENSLAKNSQSARRKPLNIVAKDGQFAIDGDEGSIRQTFGTANPDLASQLMLGVQLGSPSSLLGLNMDRNSSLAALDGIAPRNALEGMLSTQMVAVHNHAMDSLRKASRSGQPDHVVDGHAATAMKFMRTFCMQMETLSKHRNSVTQNMVQEVHVHDSGQAIVGAIGVQQTGNKREDEHENPNGFSAQKRLAEKRKHSR
jgi:hypothetical protein